MTIKKNSILAIKKSTAKKKTEAANSKTKSVNSKQTFKKKFNEFGDDDSL